VDLIEKPAEGMIHGPLEAGLGIVTGAKSLFKNTFIGAFNSVEKLMGTLSSGIAIITMVAGSY